VGREGGRGRERDRNKEVEGEVLRDSREMGYG
jgi:hypothetical protein